MKKRFAGVLLLLTVLLCGCGRTPEMNEDTQIKVGFSQLGSESDWRMANTKSMTAALSEESGFELLFDNAKQRQENQLLAIRNFIQEDVDYIVLAPIMESGWDDVLLEAREAEIPVIIVDREISVDDESLYACWVGSDFRAEGDRAVAWLEESLIQQGRENEPLRILHIQGTDGATAQIGRTEALDRALETHPNWVLAGRLPGEYTEAKSYELVRDFLKTDRNVDVIYSENDNMSFGAMQALDEAGISYGADGQVMLLSFDAVHRAMVLCQEGKINACIECNPLHGPRVAMLIRQMESGETPEKQNFVEEGIFSAETVTDELMESREY